MAGMERSKLYSFDDFCSLVGDGEKADLIDGVIYMASPDNTDANALFVWLLRLLGDYIDLKKLGKLYGSRVAFRLGEGHAPEPDIAFVRRTRLHLVRRGFVNGPPDLAIEIVSPESLDRDYTEKRQQYREGGVLEYWIIDEIVQKVSWLRLTSNGSYREVKPRDGALHSQVLPGFWLRPEWLWQVPLPSKAEVLAHIVESAE